MKKIIIENQEVEVRKYEASKQFLEINTCDDLDLDDLWTDGDHIYTWDDAIGSYVKIWEYC